MKTIQIIKGTFGHLPEGATAVVLKDAKSGPFEVADAVADRLVKQGIAEIAGEAAGDDFVAAYDETMTKKQLIEVGKQLGVELNDKMSKATMLEALDAAAAGDGDGDADGDEDDDASDDAGEGEGDGEAPPAITPAQPE